MKALYQIPCWLLGGLLFFIALMLWAGAVRLLYWAGVSEERLAEIGECFEPIGSDWEM